MRQQTSMYVILPDGGIAWQPDLHTASQGHREGIMKHLIEYNAAPAADRFREVDTDELAEIIREIRQSEASASAAGDGYYDNWLVDIGAATRAAELMDAFGERIFVARDEDGYYFAHKTR